MAYGRRLLVGITVLPSEQGGKGARYASFTTEAGKEMMATCRYCNIAE